MYMSHLECPKCNANHNPHKLTQVCPDCGAPLLVRYDLNKVKDNFKKEDLVNRKPDLWRYRELLPLIDEKNKVSLGEGMTPLIAL
ncbi:MAG: thrC 2, partial [Sporomusa sp.]|nr:thrC 2 [Sporomusa sp.]